MLILPVSEALTNVRSAKDASNYPAKDDARILDGMARPTLTPTFSVTPGQQVFTVGSCFARNIENRLGEFNVPTRHFELPPGEIAQGLGNRILNEYNPGTISQRLVAAATGEYFDRKGIIEEGEGYADALLPGGIPVSEERVMQRRQQIDDVYRELAASDLVILTFGFIEAWFDREDGIYINRAPGAGAFRRGSDRYELRILEVDEIVSLVGDAIGALVSRGLKRIIITVSPVPLQKTFSGMDCVTANMRSKATLVVAANQLAQAFQQVDYFPSFEMVTSLGGEAFEADNVHVRPNVVAVVTDYMIGHYVRR